jgi:hypothetical protein
MPYKITINGMTVECERPEDVLALANVKDGNARRPSEQKTSEQNGRAKWAKKKTDYQPLRRFLTEVSRPAEGRIELVALAKALGFDAPKGLGGYWTQLNKACAKFNFKPNRVVTKEAQNGERYYVAGPDIHDLLKRLPSAQ